MLAWRQKKLFGVRVWCSGTLQAFTAMCYRNKAATHRWGMCKQPVQKSHTRKKKKEKEMLGKSFCDVGEVKKFEI